MPASLNATKNRMMGKKSSSSFMRLVSLVLRLEVQRGRIHAVAQARVGGPVGKHVAQVGAALGADGLGAHHAVAGVGDFLDGAGHRLREARPAAAGVELGGGIEQLGAAADAVVAAVVPHRLVFAGEGPLGRGMARDFEGAALGAFLREQCFPLGVGLLDRVGHEEQLISIWVAQSGGNPAFSSWPGCSSNGAWTSASKSSTSE